MKKKIEVSNRYSWFMSAALAVSIGVIGSEAVDNKSLEEEIAAAVSYVKDESENSKDWTNENKTDKNSNNVEVLEDVVEESKENKENKEADTINIQYSFQEEQLAEQFYKTAALDYGTLFYGPAKEKPSAFGTDDEYSLEVPHQETESEILTEGEAEDKIKKIEYAYLFGTPHDISFEERRKVDWYIMCNPSYAGIFMANALTRDVNYGSL